MLKFLTVTKERGEELAGLFVLDPGERRRWRRSRRVPLVNTIAVRGRLRVLLGESSMVLLLLLVLVLRVSLGLVLPLHLPPCPVGLPSGPISFPPRPLLLRSLPKPELSHVVLDVGLGRPAHTGVDLGNRLLQLLLQRLVARVERRREVPGVWGMSVSSSEMDGDVTGSLLMRQVGDEEFLVVARELRHLVAGLVTLLSSHVIPSVLQRARGRWTSRLVPACRD